MVDVEPYAYRICDISGLPWIEIDFQEDVAAATRDVLPKLEALLLMTLTAEQAYVAFDQRIARFFVRCLSKNTSYAESGYLIQHLLGLAVAWMYTQGGAMAHAAGALFIVTVWLDHVDGELARATGRTSDFGHYFPIILLP